MTTSRSRSRHFIIPLVPWVLAAAALSLVAGQAPARAAEPPRTTPVGEKGFHLTLPGLWSKLPQRKGGPLVYRPTGGREQVTVSVLDLSKAFSGAQRHELIKMMLTHRQNSERRDAGASVTFGDVEYKEGRASYSARYVGTREHKPHHFATLIAASAKGAWTFFYESYEDSDAAFGKRAGAIMNSATVDE
jgi:hypothetical protein